jgi:hypothetical protein
VHVALVSFGARLILRISGPPCTLLAFVDDATSRLMELRLVTSEAARLNV